jgi:predicted nucleotidyltransferase
MTREEQIKSMVADVMRQFAPQLRGHRVVLFGSRASGKARPRSDFDVGVIGDKALPLRVFYEIDDMLENLPTLYRIDWVDLNNAAPSLRERALANAEVIYE